MSASASYQVVRYRHGKVTYEVLAKLGTVPKYREGNLGLDKVLFADEIFTNVQKGEKAKGTDLRAAFGTDNVTDCIKVILTKGEFQLTADQRREKVEAKKREIINYIHKYYIDPRAKTPHPVTRIENALETLKIHVDPDLPVDRQIPDIVKRLPEVMPVKKSEIEATISVPHAFLGASAGVIARYCHVNREQYTDEGCNMAISLVPGDYDSLLAEMNRITKGAFQIDVVGAEATATTTTTPTRGGKGGGRGKRGGH
ncbi:rRNA metabolism protein, SBDS family [Pelomyxa schiedti]|nr:rRNA metabolism protein, SBDS family [Pelomyxa schiedti]